MKLSFLGNWSALAPAGKSNTSFVADDRYAFDFGPSALSAMLSRGMDPNNLEQVFISHMHYDHFAGLIGLLWHRAMSQNNESLMITGPDGIKRATEALLRNYLTPPAFHIYATFDEDGAESGVEVFKGSHSVPDNGYRFHSGVKTLFYTGDTMYSADFVQGSDRSDILVHEMTYTDQQKLDAELWKHSTVSDALRVMEESGSRILIPVHLSEGTERMLPTLQQKNQVLMPEGDILV